MIRGKRWRKEKRRQSTELTEKHGIKKIHALPTQNTDCRSSNPAGKTCILIGADLWFPFKVGCAKPHLGIFQQRIGEHFIWFRIKVNSVFQMVKEARRGAAHVKQHSGKGPRANELTLEGAPAAAEKADTLFSMINTSTVDHLQCRKKNLLKGARLNTPQGLSKQFNNTLNLI